MSALRELKPRYDVAVIGGGVHGAAAAQAAARLGYGVLLVERRDFCAGTSANSLKIIHGGLRYLQTLDLRRSRESAREQSRLLQAAPHLVAPLPCLIGTERSIFSGRFAMALGLWFYDNVIRAGLPRHPHGRLLSPAEANRLAGADLFGHCTGAALWYDARALDTERLVITYLKTAELAGARVLNYVSATSVAADDDGATLSLRDAFTGDESQVRAGVVIDTGSLLASHPSWARAVNLVLKREPPECAAALRLRKGSADSNRLFFATPHRDALIVGTWYFPDRSEAPEKLRRDELDRCVEDARSLLPGLGITPDDVSAVHLGRLPVSDGRYPLSLLNRPVVRTVAGSRRLVSVTGVKYTTAGPTATRALRLAGVSGPGEPVDTAAWYGAAPAMETVVNQVRDLLTPHMTGPDAGRVIDRLCRQYGAAALDIARVSLALPGGLERIPGCDAVDGEIQYCIDQEYCRTLGDFLLRRSGLGSAGPPPAGAAEHVTAFMAQRFDWPEARVRAALDELDAHYLPVAADL